MKVEIFSYRFAQEIIQHERHENAWEEIYEIITNAPLFIYPNKSARNRNLYVVQQLLNTYFDIILINRYNWLFHPLATRIENSGLRADFRKSFGNLIIQAEIQFGNMARWYSDIFKFQTAYSQSLINIGLSVVPMSELSKVIDSNVVNFERTIKELPSAELSITLPILLIGIDRDNETRIIDVSRCQFEGIADISGKGKRDNRCKIVNGFLNNVDMADIGPVSPIGFNPYQLADYQEEE